MPIETYIDIMQTFAKAGCKAATITGGGEPTLHKDINSILMATNALGIEAGMVTNGMSLDRVSDEALKTLIWLRISFSDDRDYDEAFVRGVLDAVDRAKVDYAFSYVVTASPNIPNIEKIIGLANDLNFTHVRLVTDLLDIDNVPSMGYIKAQLDVDDSRVIYQGRKEYRHGRKDCRVSLVKPVISADGGWYPCCGVQYALESTGLDFERSMCMGVDPQKVIDKHEHFDGSRCVRCYYDDYNQVLAAMVNPVEHGNFI
jgi:MoaA/NifB/PqqE/SkfB family radical SAM enzyme